MTMNEHEVTTPTRRVRISVRAVLAGAVVQLVAIGLLLMLAGGIGLWPMGPLSAEKLAGVSAGLALFGGVAWVIAASLGGYLATVVSGSTDRRDGILQGVMSWSTACAAAAVLGCAWFMSAIAADLASPDLASAINPRLMLAFFVGDLLALAGAITGGIAGARAEARLARRQPPAGRLPIATPRPTHA